MFDFKKINIKKWVIVILFVAIAVFLAFDSYFTVDEQSNAVVLTAGNYTDTKSAGLHFKIPIIQTYTIVNMTTRGMALGYTTSSDSSIASSNTNDSIMITNDFNLVSIDFYIEWRVTDPVKSLYEVDDPETVLRNAVQSSARDIVSIYGVDSVLTDGKSEIQTKIKELVNDVLERYDIGLVVMNVMIQDAEPPNEEVKVAFKAVEDAKQKKDTLLNEATKYRNENIPGARAEADKIIKSAEGVKESRINEANGQVARFNQMFAEYINNSAVTKTRMYYEAIEEILPSIKVIIDTTDSSTLKMLDLNQNANVSATE